MNKLRLAIATCLFLVTAALGIRNNWTAGDLVWASWISGAVVGVGLVILSLASFSLVRNASLRAGCMVIVLGLFLPLWGVLQFALAAGLHRIFPLSKARFDLILTLSATLSAYWPFVLMSALAEFNGLRSYWRLAGRMGERGSYPVLIFGLPVSTGRMFLIVFLLACLTGRV